MRRWGYVGLIEVAIWCWELGVRLARLGDRLEEMAERVSGKVLRLPVSSIHAEHHEADAAIVRFPLERVQ